MMKVLSIDRYLEYYSVNVALMNAQDLTKSDVHLCIFCRIKFNKRVKDIFLKLLFLHVQTQRCRQKWVDQFTEGLKNTCCTPSRIDPHIWHKEE